MSDRKYATEKIDQDGNLEVTVDHDYPGELVLRIESGPKGAWIYYFKVEIYRKKSQYSWWNDSIPNFSKDKRCFH